MGIIDWLRKLGILRTGAIKATYRNGKDRPDEFLMSDVLDADKDLIRKGPPGQDKPASPTTRT